MTNKHTNVDHGLRKSGLKVQVRNNNVTQAYRKLKRKIQEDGVLQTYKDKQYYEKPCLKRKRERASARKRWLKRLQEINKAL